MKKGDPRDWVGTTVPCPWTRSYCTGIGIGIGGLKVHGFGKNHYYNVGTEKVWNGQTPTIHRTIDAKRYLYDCNLPIQSTQSNLIWGCPFSQTDYSGYRYVY